MSQEDPQGQGNGPIRTPVPERSVLSVLRDIKTHLVDPKSLGEDARRDCVEELTAEGYSTAEIADILGVTDRTVRRDRERIRAANAVERDPDLEKQFVGDLVRQAEIAISHIRRAARGNDARPADRIAAGRDCWRITRELAETLQALGWLPTRSVGQEGG